MTLISAQTSRYLAVTAGVAGSALLAHQLWKQLGPSNEAISTRLNQGFSAIKGAVQQGINALSHVEPADVKLTSEDINQARRVALDAMKGYSLNRAIESHPEYNPQKPFSEEKIQALKLFYIL